MVSCLAKNALHFVRSFFIFSWIALPSHIILLSHPLWVFMTFYNILTIFQWRTWAPSLPMWSCSSFSPIVVTGYGLACFNVLHLVRKFGKYFHKLNTNRTTAQFDPDRNVPKSGQNRCESTIDHLSSYTGFSTIKDTGLFSQLQLCGFRSLSALFLWVFSIVVFLVIQVKFV